MNMTEDHLNDVTRSPTSAPVLELRQISKSFPGVKALSEVSLSLEPGTVHVVCGENGAGKSTLMKIIDGVHQPDFGEIFIEGQRVVIRNPLEAHKLKISMIFQELNYIPENTIEQHLFLGIEPVKRLGNIDWKTIRKQTTALLEKEELAYSPVTKLKDLSLSDVQMIEILKAVSIDARIIIMDEPTSALSEGEVSILFNKIRDLRDRGVGIIYISHKLDEIFSIADYITILRDGEAVATKKSDELDKDMVISLMVGRTMDHLFPDKHQNETGDVILEVKDLGLDGKFANVSFSLARGEIVGMAGLVGAGRTELARSLIGLDNYTRGSVTIRGERVEVSEVSDSLSRGMVMVSEDRRRLGIIPMRDIVENVTISKLEKTIFGGYCHTLLEKQIVGNICDSINVRAASYRMAVENLSGGNQQKVVLAKWLLCDPDILILDEPTRGIDVGTKYEIYKIMHQLATEDKAILFISSELPELIGVCDRILVMAKGRLVGELLPKDFSQETIMELAMDVRDKTTERM